MPRRTPDNAGVFYIVRWEPEVPNVYKFGWTCDMDRRLYQHRIDRMMPNATVVRSWPCASRWEKAALVSLAPYLGLCVHGTETFGVADIGEVIRWLDDFFQDRDQGIPAPAVIPERSRSSRDTGPEWMLVGTAAPLIDVSVPTLYRMIREGRITAYERTYMKRNRFMVSVADVQRFVTEAGRDAAPPPAPDAP